MTRKLSVLLFTSVITFLVCILLVTVSDIDLRERDFDYANATRDDTYVHFLTDIRAGGAGDAYATFVSAARFVPVDRQHILAHVFGEALYDEIGLEGFAACDLRFMYGCFHELMGRTINEHGLSIVPEVYRLCMHTQDPRRFACLHGIGHGIIAALGYTSEHIEHALTTCDAIEPSRLVAQCYAGVFMEYNQQSMLGTEYVRQVAENLYAPCTEVPGAYAESCMFEQPQWWHRVLENGSSTSDAFSALGRLCEEGSLNGSATRACFEGIGNIVTPAVNYDVRRSVELCEAASSDSLHQLYCKSIAALSLTSAVRDVSRGEGVCADLRDRQLEFCLAYAHNEANMANPKSTELL